MKRILIILANVSLLLSVFTASASPACAKATAEAQRSNGGGVGNDRKLDWATISTNNKNGIVLVRSFNAITNLFEPYAAPQQCANTGTAFFVQIEEEHYLLSNFHVIEDAVGVYIEVPSCGKELFEAEVVRVRPSADLALLKLKRGELDRLHKELGGAIPCLTLGDSDVVTKTQEVMAMGFPLSDEGMKTTTGIISGKERIDSEYYLQITAPINFGNSGGPTVNYCGEVIGMNSRVRMFAQNTGYMIPSNTIKHFINSAMKNPDQVVDRKPIWGVSALPASNELYRHLGCMARNGIYVNKVIKGSLLEAQGLKAGDILCSVNGHDLDRYGYTQVSWSQDNVHFVDVLSRLEVGDTATFIIDRSGEKITITAPVDFKNVFAIDDVYPRFQHIDHEMIGGLVVMPLTLTHIESAFGEYVKMIRSGHIAAPNGQLIKYLDPERRLEPRIFISNVLPNSQAQKDCASAGMILEKVNGLEVRTLSDFRTAVLKSKQTGLLSIEAEGDIVFVLDMTKIIAEEDMLSKMYCGGYRSSLIDHLV